MGAFDIMGRISLESTPFMTAVSRADARASAFADKVEHKLSKKISKYFGAGAAAGILFSPLHKVFGGVFELSDRADEITNGAKKLGLTTDEYQQLEQAAKATGDSVEGFIDKVRSGQVPMGKAIAQIKSYRAELDASAVAAEESSEASLKAANKAVTGAYASTVTGFVRLFQRLGAMSTGLSWSESGKIANQLSMEDRGVVPGGGKHKSWEELFSNQNGRPGSGFQGINEWQRIGAFVGGGETSVAQNIAKIEVHAKEQVKNTGEIKDAIRDFQGKYPVVNSALNQNMANDMAPLFGR